ncbi:hypothetical protein Ddye_018145 [Dipteronia dyeriana]|uniref:Expansin-B2 n=1 Tax=Dipteronia dyeriana TaxID=168575 RepID=A0AAD9X167_9ROSI|nr:hypothetical protein Ddye_018145 [Dipteronia dyeriana]
MAPFSLLTLIFKFSLLFNFCRCVNLRNLNVSVLKWESNNWSPAGATWYGPPTGAGSEGGACGYGDAVSQKPFSSMVSAGGQYFYQSGKGCGECFQVKCTENEACSGKPVTVVITDECPSCDSVHFDLSGTAFGAMAAPGKADQLRNAGVLQIQYTRVKCNYLGVTVASHVDSGSNTYFFATVVEFDAGEGDLAAVELQQNGQDNWLPMQRLLGC